MPRDPRIDQYIATREPFAGPILAWLRERVHAAVPDVEEAIKWGMPAFLVKGAPLANMAAFKAHCAFGFWDRAATATGREGEAMGQFGRIASIDDLPAPSAMEAVIAAAADRARLGERPRRPARAPRPEAEVPPALAQALATDDAARATWEAFSPSARRDYCDWVAEAKRDQTRATRVEQAIAWLREGKRRHWRYEAC